MVAVDGEEGAVRVGALGDGAEEAVIEPLARREADVADEDERRLRSDRGEDGVAVHEPVGGRRDDAGLDVAQPGPLLHGVEHGRKLILGEDDLAPAAGEGLIAREEGLHGPVHVRLHDAAPRRSAEEGGHERVAEVRGQRPPPDAVARFRVASDWGPRSTRPRRASSSPRRTPPSSRAPFSASARA